MKWQDITVRQFQLLGELWANMAGREPMDVMADTCAICYGLTPHQVDSLPIREFNQKCKDLDFLNEIPEWAPVKDFKANGRKYRFIYEVQHLPVARYMETKQFGQEGVIQGLHKMAASMVVRQKRTPFGWKDVPYDAAKHSEYAADILEAPITSVHGSALFFCELFQRSIEVLADYLTSTLPMEKKTAAKQSLIDSCSLLAGSTTLQSLQSMSASHSIKPTSSQPSNSLTTSPT